MSQKKSPSIANKLGDAVKDLDIFGTEMDDAM